MLHSPKNEISKKNTIDRDDWPKDFPMKLKTGSY